MSLENSLLLPPRHALARARAEAVKAATQTDRGGFDIPGATFPVDSGGERFGWAQWVSRAEALDIPDYVWCRIPEPAGWRIMVQEYAPPKVTKGGVIIADQSADWHNSGNYIGRVLAMGPSCYQHQKFQIIDEDGRKVLQAPWCQVGQWVTFARYSGTPRKIDHGREEWLFRSLVDEHIIEIAPTPDGLKVYV